MIIPIHHERILQTLFEYRNQTDANFIGRAIWNDKIDKGCWFRGNDKYLQTTFWSGSCNKSKIYNISFSIKTIRSKLYPCIEICCRYIENLNNEDRRTHRHFFEELSSKLGINEHHLTYNYWLHIHDCEDFLDGYKFIISQYKNKIDDIVSFNPIKIKKIDDVAHANFKNIIRDARREIYNIETA